MAEFGGAVKKAILNIVIVVFLLTGLDSYCQSEATRNKPVCRLEVNQQCTDTGFYTSIGVIGIDRPILHDEEQRDDTVFMSLVEVEGKRYRDASTVNSAGRDFYIYISFGTDTAQFRVVDPDGDIHVETVDSSWFVISEPLREILVEVVWVHIALEKNRRNIFSYGCIMRTARRRLHNLGEMYYPQDGLYRRLPRITRENTRNLEYCTTPKGIAIFIRLDYPDSAAMKEQAIMILNDIADKWSQ